MNRRSICSGWSFVFNADRSDLWPMIQFNELLRASHFIGSVDRARGPGTRRVRVTGQNSRGQVLLNRGQSVAPILICSRFSSLSILHLFSRARAWALLLRRKTAPKEKESGASKQGERASICQSALKGFELRRVQAG